MTVQECGKGSQAEVSVRFTTAGTPLAVRHDGRAWAVAAEPVHWYGRCNWWERDGSAARGTGDLINVEYWQLQVRLTASSALRTFTIRREPRGEEWVLESILDCAA